MRTIGAVLWTGFALYGLTKIEFPEVKTVEFFLDLIATFTLCGFLYIGVLMILLHKED